MSVINQCGVSPRAVAIALACAALIQTSSAHSQSESGQNVAAAEGGDIVVTAQRRAERAVDVPISLTALGGEALASAGVTSTRDLNIVVPGLNFASQGSWAQPAIRGVSSEGSYPGSDVNVAVYLDGIYQPNQQGNIFDLPDVERVEVLRGPQGTLFGRNATGGAIQIITREPGYETSGQITASYGRYSRNGGDEYGVRGYVNVPLVDQKAALSISGIYRNDSGFLYDDLRNRRTGKVESGMLRARLLLEPSDGVRLIASGYYRSSSDANAQAMQVLNRNTLGLAIDPTLFVPNKPYHVSLDEFPITHVEGWGASLKAEFSLGGGTLTSLTGYQDSYDVSVHADVDGTSLALVRSNVSQPNRTFSQEVTYASENSGPFNWVAGLFYYNDHGGPFVNDVLVFGGASPFYATVNTRAYAAFGEVKWNATDNLSVIAGLRYSHERKGVLAGLTPNPPATASKSWDAWTPRFSAIYELTPRANIYATFSKGFKSGIYDPTTTIAGLNNPANPETLNSYEIGFKTSGDVISMNAAAFYYDYTNLQRQIFNGVTTEVQNAADARVIGAEVEATVRPSQEFQLRGNVSWLPTAKYTTYKNAAVNVPTGFGGNDLRFIDAGGLRLIRAPRYTFSLSADWNHQLAKGAIGAGASIFHSDDFNYETLGRVRQESYTTVNAQLFWQISDPGLRVSVFARNLFNTVYFQSALPSQLADLVGFAPPRQIGLSVGYSF